MGPMTGKHSALGQTMHRSALTIATGLVLGGLVAGFFGTQGVTASAQMAQVAQTDRCAGGDEVSAFICRNTWLASTKRFAYGRN